MPRLNRDPAERLVLSVCRAVLEAHADRRLRWSTVDQVQALLPTVSDAQLEAAIAVAVERGWLQSAGRPAHSVLLTAQGRGALAPAAKRSAARSGKR